MGFYFEVFLLKEVDLCSLSRKGWILAPSETKDHLFSRKDKLSQEMGLEKRSGILPLTQSLYDFQCEEFFVLYSDDSLRSWQGAVLWEYESKQGDKYPVVQLRKSFSNGFLGLYDQEEILAHELVHVARFAFKEPLFEEILAYQTSKCFFRRFFGPLFLYPFESALLAIFSLMAPIFSLFFESFWGVFLLIFLFCFFLIRLFLLQSLFLISRKKIEKMGVSSAFSLAVILRLSDIEIVKAAISSPLKTREEWKNKAEKDPRFKVILNSYF